ncbi:PIN domain protein [Caldibacillus phage CBP1]|uniref:PIN domain n=1 Tax=Caldibacillus debilis GB1 TaxID=1339248 RepID=A0A420VIS3_9BACI|nr:PIN domain-containing protein [Caldibacillus debilis]ATB52747.1 PIN domain protein [Caldibacillus phage CBP1]RKO63572.1 PIN domain [Caldibacillus debilis GB1]
MNRTSTSFSIRKESWNNQSVFPDLIYIDTNVVLDIMEQRTYGRISEEYLKELVRRDGMIIWSRQLIDELIDFFHYQIYKEEASNKNIIVPKGINATPGKWLENIATDSDSANYARQVLEKVENVTKYLEQFGVQDDPDHEEVNSLGLKIYSEYGGNRKDSMHVANAILSGTNNILTHDAGFLRYPYINVFGASKAIVNSNTSINNPNDFVDLRELFEKDEKKDENKAGIDENKTEEEAI